MPQLLSFFTVLFLLSTWVMADDALSDLSSEQVVLQKVAFGKLLFNDKTLSQPAGQSCNSCHMADAHYADPGKMVSPGANPVLFGNRNAPSLSYVQFNPGIYWDIAEDHWVGGLFLDGRANTLHDQVIGPFLNPLEMGVASEEALIAKVKAAAYAPAFEALYGKAVWDSVESAVYAISDAIVAYEQGPEFALFTSKYDYFLKGEVALTALEQKGLALFEAEDKANCAACHPSAMGDNNEPPLFTDYTYDNLGLPANTALPFKLMAKQHNPDGKNYIDYGLATNPNINNGPDEKGKFKVSTLRNIAATAPYMHDGSFATLREVIEFYNARDVSDKWDKPEVQHNLNTDELGDLKLSEEDIDALLAFMETLTDGYQLP
mgnify:CR=1 FL=1